MELSLSLLNFLVLQVMMFVSRYGIISGEEDKEARSSHHYGGFMFQFITLYTLCHGIDILLSN